MEGGGREGAGGGKGVKSPTMVSSINKRDASACTSAMISGAVYLIWDWRTTFGHSFCI